MPASSSKGAGDRGASGLRLTSEAVDWVVERLCGLVVLCLHARKLLQGSDSQRREVWVTSKRVLGAQYVTAALRLGGHETLSVAVIERY
jgi:hypothetical protein